MITSIMSLCLFASVSNIYADDQYEYNVEDNTNVETEEVEEVLEDTMEDQDESQEEMITEESFDISKYDMENSYTEYLLSDLPITEYYEDTSFKDLLSKDYRIKIPYVTTDNEDGVIICTENEKGKLSVQAEVILGEQQSLYISPKKISEIVNEGIKEEIQEVTYVYSNRYYMTLVYVKTESGEYAIPFAELGTDKIESGKIYSVSDFFKNMNKVFDESLLEEGSLGGLPYRKYHITVFDFVKVGAAIVLFIGTIIFLSKMIIVKKKRKQYNAV